MSSLLPLNYRARRRVPQLLAGVTLFPFSIALILHADLGAMPWDVLTLGIMQWTPLSFGVITLVMSAVILLLWIPLKQRIGLGTIANAVFIGVLIDPMIYMLSLLPEYGLAVDIGFLVSGIIVNGIATSLYVGSRFGPGPRDGLMTGLLLVTRKPLVLIRTSIEVTVVLVGWLLGGTVGFGTLAYALGVGPVIQVLLPRWTTPDPPQAVKS